MKHVLVVVATAVFPIAVLTFAPPLPAKARVDARPNVVVIITDDQSIGTFDAMPIVTERLLRSGLNLTNGLIPTSVCCPSRSSLLTGLYAHTTGVYTNLNHNHGGWRQFHRSRAERTTLATELDAVGYTTGLFGKYLNGFHQLRPDGFVPPGWDQFITVDPDSTAYYDYTLEGTIDPEFHGERETDYSTDVIAGKVVDFIQAAPADDPLFVYFAPVGPHSPFTPAPRDIGTWPLEPSSAIAALNEVDVSDKPAWVQDNPLVDALTERERLTLQHETLMSVDDAVGQILDALGDRVSNTLFVFLSDNGYMLGAHRINGKDVPYRRSTEVPMIVRWDGHFDAGVNSGRPTTNTDLTATITEAAGITMTTEGKSLLSSTRSGTVLEQIAYVGHPAYCGYRTRRYLFVEYDEGEGREFYDYAVDPDELRNGIDSPRYSDVIAQLRERAKAECDPVPPGFNWE